MKLLAVETATEGCSAALAVDRKIYSRFEIAPRRHAEIILPMCESLIAEAGIALSQLDAIAFGRGPGAFTGVRIAAGVAQGLAYGLERPVVPVSTLAALAQEIMTELGKASVLVAIDARMGEIYWGCYQRDQQDCARLIGEERVGKAEDVIVPADRTWYGAGSGWDVYGETLANRLGNSLEGYDGQRLPRAEYIAGLAEIAFAEGLAVPAEQAQPVYLRDNVAKKSHEV
ncbi:MAG: tRNA (adenosine(37)-N6)-threonylcarbamoyltransferase complex dimerization subunit type 1 TsaB [Gammaproteobacteria bacterium]